MLTPPPLTPWEFVGYAWSNGEAGTVDTRETPRTRSFGSSVTSIEHELAWADADLPGRSDRTTSRLPMEERMLALAGTGYGLIGLLIIILLVVLIFYFVRRV